MSNISYETIKNDINKYLFSNDNEITYFINGSGSIIDKNDNKYILNFKNVEKILLPSDNKIISTTNKNLLNNSFLIRMKNNNNSNIKCISLFNNNLLYFTIKNIRINNDLEILVSNLENINSLNNLSSSKRNNNNYKNDDNLSNILSSLDSTKSMNDNISNIKTNLIKKQIKELDTNNYSNSNKQENLDSDSNKQENSDSKSNKKNRNKTARDKFEEKKRFNENTESNNVFLSYFKHLLKSTSSLKELESRYLQENDSLENDLFKFRDNWNKNIMNNEELQRVHLEYADNWLRKQNNYSNNISYQINQNMPNNFNSLHNRKTYFPSWCLHNLNILSLKNTMFKRSLNNEMNKSINNRFNSNNSNNFEFFDNYNSSNLELILNPMNYYLDNLSESILQLNNKKLNISCTMGRKNGLLRTNINEFDEIVLKLEKDINNLQNFLNNLQFNFSGRKDTNSLSISSNWNDNNCNQWIIVYANGLSKDKNSNNNSMSYKKEVLFNKACVIKMNSNNLILVEDENTFKSCLESGGVPLESTDRRIYSVLNEYKSKNEEVINLKIINSYNLVSFNVNNLQYKSNKNNRSNNNSSINGNTEIFLLDAMINNFKDYSLSEISEIPSIYLSLKNDINTKVNTFMENRKNLCNDTINLIKNSVSMNGDMRQLDILNNEMIAFMMEGYLLEYFYKKNKDSVEESNEKRNTNNDNILIEQSRSFNSIKNLLEEKTRNIEKDYRNNVLERKKEYLKYVSDFNNLEVDNTSSNII